MSLHRRTRSRRAVNALTAIVVSVGVLLATTSCTPAAQRFIAAARASKTATVSHPRVRSSHAIADQLFAKINAERRNRGMRQLRTSRLLTRYAAHWGRHLIATRQFRHQNLGHIIVASHYRLAEVGENLFRGSGRGAIDAGTAHTSLMRSPSHRANILLPQAQVVGIAALCTRGKLMVVEEFGIKAGAPLPKQGQGVMPLRPLIAKNLGGSHC
jgi:uncharacterized protein YkwD